MIVTLPDMFMALAFEPSSQIRMDACELELCRVCTMEYLLPKLQSHYPQLIQMKIQFKDFEWGTERPTKKFQAYWKVDMSMMFDVAPSSQSALPRPSRLFDKAGELFQNDCYFEFLKTFLRGSDCKLLMTASDVQFGLLSQSMEGGAVKTPNFYVGFVCNPPPTQRPNKEELECLRKRLLKLMLQTIREGYPTSFNKSPPAPSEGLYLSWVKSEINDQARKPFQKFNLYIEFEATGTFRMNAPSAMSFYVQLASFSLGEFLESVKQMGGTIFGSVTGVAINPCAWIENLDEAVPSNPMSLGEMIPVHVEFWIALAIPDLARVPDDKQRLLAFDEMMNEIVHTTLVTTYGNYNYHSMDLQRESCEFQANVPLPRFNVLHRYKADIFFQNPIPLPSQVLTAIMRCDVGTLLGKIVGLPAPWNRTVEGTLGNAMFEQISEEKVYEGRRSDVGLPPRTPPPTPIPLPKQQKEHHSKERTESCAVGVDATPSPVQTSSPSSEVTVTMLVPCQSPGDLKPKSRIPLLPESVKGVSSATPALPVPTAPVPSETLEFWAEIYVALAIPESPEPTAADYVMLAKATQSYYAKFLSKRYGKDTFERILLSVRGSKYNAGIPESKYNIYVEWGVQAFFNSTNGKAPDRLQFCQSLVTEIDMFVYLKDKVRGIRKTPFENAVAIYTEQVNSVIK